MRFGKAFELRYNFVKLYRESRKSKVEYFGTFSTLTETSKCVDCRKIPVISGIIYRNFWPYLEPFWPFLEPFWPFLEPFWPLLEPLYTGMYRKMSKISKIAVDFRQIPSNVEIFDYFGSFGKVFAKVESGIETTYFRTIFDRRNFLTFDFRHLPKVENFGQTHGLTWGYTNIDTPTSSHVVEVRAFLYYIV